MKKIIFLLVLFMMSCSSEKSKSVVDFTTIFEASEGKETSTYHQVIQYYNDLAKNYSEIDIQPVGETDSGEPLHIVILNPDSESKGYFDENEDYNFEAVRQNNRIMLINNGIHPGESDGIDATMMLFRDIVQGNIDMPKRTVLVAIPVYNVGGSLNRNSGTRANQNGPESYGFRGNARNYDLNRDFIKCDTKNAKAFTKIFHYVQPDVFIDNHVSNGADYQYTLTHLFTQHNKLGHDLGDFLHNTMQPELEQKLATKDWDITPYVNVFNRTPESGFSQFMDSPRYSTGYTTLFNTLGMMVETHMLKPYKPRVEGTYELMKSMIEITETHHDKIGQLRQNAIQKTLSWKNYPIGWEIDTSKTTTLKFKGYEGIMEPSDITGAQRLKYDRSKPFTKDVTYQNYFRPSQRVAIPKGYIIPQGLHHVIDLLKLNSIDMRQLANDTTITVESYRVVDYKTRTRPYEGHYLHYNTSVSSTIKNITFLKGDYVIDINQNGIRYLLETLEPAAPDSFFNWNFFDTILQQKEGFSPYVFEETAKAMLDNDPELKIQFEHWKQDGGGSGNNWYAQLDWLYKRSKHYESAHLQYPVYRITK